MGLKVKQVTRGAENAQAREGASRSTRSHDTVWNKLRKYPFFSLQKKGLKSQPFTLNGPGPAGRAGSNRFSTNISQEHATRAKSQPLCEKTKNSVFSVFLREVHSAMIRQSFRSAFRLWYCERLVFLNNLVF